MKMVLLTNGRSHTNVLEHYLKLQQKQTEVQQNTRINIKKHTVL